MGKHAEPEKYPTKDRAEQRMRDDAAKRPPKTEPDDQRPADYRGRHAADDKS